MDHGPLIRYVKLWVAHAPGTFFPPTLILNANCISGKRTELANIVDYTKPDAILITDTKLDASIKSSEFLPPGYSQPKHRDRTFAGGGRVLIAVCDCYTAVEIDPPTSLALHDEIIWVEVSLRNKQKLILDCFHRTLSGKPHQQLDGLKSSLNNIRQVTRNNVRSTIILGGDFKLVFCRSWKHQGPGEKLITVLRDHHLSRLQHETTRKDRALDLLCTSNGHHTLGIGPSRYRLRQRYQACLHGEKT